jgi:hypothetical protein
MTPNRWTPEHISRALGWRARALLHKAKLGVGKALLPRLGPTVAFMARTGAGTNECLAHGALPMPVHFYSPVPDIPDLHARKVWNHRSRMEGIDFAPERQLTFMAEIGERFGRECDWPHKSVDPLAFHTDNSGFSYGCATSLHCILRHYKPRRVIEVGSGNSTRVIAGALRRNKDEGHAADFMVVDPYPGEDTKRIPEITRFEVERVELVDPSLFDELGENDVLFVDSGHTVRIGGDVNFMILDVLPRLKPGVVVHFHDIPMPFEYNEVYFTNPAFRMFWTESYLLQAFLALNESYETLMALSWIMTDHVQEFAKAYPHYNPAIHVNTSSSYWIRRTR